MWTEKEFLILKNNYGILYMEDLMALLPNRSYNAIINKARKNNLKRKNIDSRTRRKYFFDVNYFKSIDTPNKAYYLGWIITDGNIKGNQCRIRLQKDDADILEKFSTDIKSTYPIYFRDKDKNRELVLSHRDLIKDLEKYGCIENKTNKVIFPVIPKEFIWDFIKGIFDGDGSYINTIKTHKVTFCSASDSFIISLKEILDSYNIKCNITNYTKFFVLEIGGVRSISIFLNYILSTKSDFLNRKLKKMLELKTYINC